MRIERTRRGVVTALLSGAGAAAVATLVGWAPRLAHGRGYHAVARWRTPAGEGRFVAIDAEQNDVDLPALGGRLRDEFSRTDNVVVMVFDDADAARTVRRGSRAVGEERFQAALHHQRAMYLKQAGRGEDRFTIYETYPRIREVIRY